MQIRLAKSSDVGNLVKLDKDANLTNWSKEDYQGSLNNKQQFIYVLEEHGKILGCIALGVIVDEAEILQFWISRSCHRQGYGRHFFTKILNELRVHYQAQQVFLEVRDGNTAAINLYTQAGFIQVGKRNNYYNVETWQFDAIIMHKQF